jgi:hypothetical protein
VAAVSVVFASTYAHHLLDRSLKAGAVFICNEGVQ